LAAFHRHDRENGDTIVGRWELSDGSTWNDNFGLTYTRVR
jgi:hypothetical protein